MAERNKAQRDLNRTGRLTPYDARTAGSVRNMVSEMMARADVSNAFKRERARITGFTSN